MQRTWPTHFDVVGTVEHSREDDLGERHGDRDPVSIYPAFFAPYTFAALSLLLDLNGLLRHSANLLLRAGVVVGKVLVLDLGRRLSNGCNQLFLCSVERGRFLVPRDD